MADISTVISIVPQSIQRFLPGIVPGSFTIPAGNADNPQALKVRTSMQFLQVEGRKEPISVATASYEIANAIVNDYNTGQLVMSGMPGLRAFLGEVNPKTFITTHHEDYTEMVTAQIEWFKGLVEIADIDWGKYPGNHRVISAASRIAARSLGLDRPWLIESKEPMAVKMIDCPYCEQPVKPTQSVCHHCKFVIKPTEIPKEAFPK
jgi:hypothetical protein